MTGEHEGEHVLEPDDTHTGSHTEGDETGCAEEVAPEHWDPDGDPLARGAGEQPDGDPADAEPNGSDDDDEEDADEDDEDADEEAD
jgi:hypothetical protein